MTLSKARESYEIRFLGVERLSYQGHSSSISPAVKCSIEERPWRCARRKEVPFPHGTRKSRKDIGHPEEILKARYAYETTAKEKDPAMYTAASTITKREHPSRSGPANMYEETVEHDIF